MASRLLTFRGKVAIVTGGGGGLGEKYAVDLARRGATVIVNDISQSADRVRAVVKRIISEGGTAKENINSVLDGKEIVADALNSFGTCDILINNAGILRDKSFHKMSKNEWKEVLDVHLEGTFELCHAAWPTLREKQYGRIVNIASGAGLYGNFGQANYSTAKMGILGLTNTLAIEGSKYNITTNCVIPIAASQMTANLLPPEYLELLDADHVTGIVSYLAHESSHAVNGEAFEVGGGWYSKIRWQRSAGVSVSGMDKFASAEDIAANFESICDFGSSTNPKELADSLKAMVSASATSRALNKTSDSTQIHTVSDVEATPPSALSDAVCATSPADSVTCVGSAPALLSERCFLEIEQYFAANPMRAIEAGKAVDAAIRFQIRDSAGQDLQSWKVTMTNSNASIVKEDNNTEKVRTDLLITCSDSTFVSLREGKLSPEFAYMRGLVELKGSVQKGLKFFKFYSTEITSKQYK